MKSLLLLLATGVSLFAQTTGTASRTNSNTYQAGKSQIFLGVVDMGTATQTMPCRKGAGAPTGQNGTVGDCYYNTSATAGANLYWATTTGTPATWTLQAGASGGGSPAGYTTVSYSATPTFTCSSTTGSSFLITLAGNVTSSTLSGCSSGQIITMNIVNDTTPRTFVFPTNMLNAGTISAVASSVTHQVFVYDGTNAQALAPAYVTGVTGGSVTIPGSSSGAMTLIAPATGGGTVTGPTGTTTLVGNAIANTGGASMTLDMSASTSAAALRTPNIAGAAPTTAGTMAYDTTNKNLHVGANAVDNVAGMFLASALPANDDCIKASVSSSVVRLTSAGAACGSGSGSAGHVPFDPTVFYAYDEFIACCGFTAATTKGQLGWDAWTAAGNGANPDTALSASMPGALAVYTGSTTSDYSGIALDGSLAFVTAPLYALGSATWHAQFIIHTDQGTVASTSYEMGFADGQGYRNANSITIRSDTTSQSCTTGTNSTTSFMLETIKAAASDCVSLVETVVANTTYLFDLTGLAGTISAKVSTDNGSTWGSTVSISNATYVPSVSLFPKFLVTTRTAAARSLYIDRWELLITGLTRP